MIPASGSNAWLDYLAWASEGETFAEFAGNSGDYVELTRLRYTADSDFSGQDSVSYSTIDRYGRVATATVTFSAVANRRPTVVRDTATVAIGQSRMIDVLANDFDPDGDRLTLSDVSTPYGASVDAVDRTAYEDFVSSGAQRFDEWWSTTSRSQYVDDDLVLVYTAGWFRGTHEFTYEVVDPGGETAEGEIEVAVVDGVASGIVARLDSAAIYRQSDSSVELDVLANDVAPEGLPLRLVDATSTFGAVEVDTAAGPEGRDIVRLRVSTEPPEDILVYYTVVDGTGRQAQGTVEIQAIDGGIAVDGDGGLTRRGGLGGTVASDEDVRASAQRAFERTEFAGPSGPAAAGGNYRLDAAVDDSAFTQDVLLEEGSATGQGTQSLDTSVTFAVGVGVTADARADAMARADAGPVDVTDGAAMIPSAGVVFNPDGSSSGGGTGSDEDWFYTETVSWSYSLTVDSVSGNTSTSTTYTGGYSYTVTASSVGGFRSTALSFGKFDAFATTILISTATSTFAATSSGTNNETFAVTNSQTFLGLGWGTETYTSSSQTQFAGAGSHSVDTSTSSSTGTSQTAGMSSRHSTYAINWARGTDGSWASGGITSAGGLGSRVGSYEGTYSSWTNDSPRRRTSRGITSPALATTSRD